MNLFIAYFVKSGKIGGTLENIEAGLQLSSLIETSVSERKNFENNVICLSLGTADQ